MVKITLPLGEGVFSLSIKFIFMQERQPRGSAHEKAFA